MNKSVIKVILIPFIFILLICLYLLYVLHLNPQPFFCRNWYGKPLTFDKYIGQVENYTDDFGVVVINGCLKEIEQQSDGDYLKIAFYKNFWFKKIYRFKIGGIESNIGLCIERDCETISSKDLINKIGNIGLIQVFVVVKDDIDYYYPDYLRDNDSYDLFIEEFKNASLGRRSFPKQKNWPLFISQIKI